jgi:hypothetical protein
MWIRVQLSKIMLIQYADESIFSAVLCVQMRLKRCGSIEMESELPSDQHFEDELGVKGQQKSYNPWALKCHRDNLRKIGIHLVKVRAPGIFFS